MLRTILRKPFNVLKYNNERRRKHGVTLTQLSNLTNGLQLATEASCSPLACISLFTLMGSRYENECNNGMSYFIEYMACRGFRSLKQDPLEEKLNCMGAKLSTYTNRGYQRFTAVGPAKCEKDLIYILSNIPYCIGFAENDIKVQRNKLKSKLMENDVNPERIVFDYLHQTAFQGTPLAQPVTPSSENINEFNRKNLNDFIKENYHSNKSVLACAGGVCHEAVAEAAETYFAAQPASQYISNPPQRYTGSQIIYRNDALPLLHAAIAVEAPGYNSDDYYPLLVGSCLTDSWDKSQGGNMNNASLLARASSTSQFCEKYKSFYIAYSDVGLWGTYFVCKPLVADDFVSYLLDSWMTLCTTVTEEQVQRAINIAKLKVSKNNNGVVNSSLDMGLQIIMTKRRKPWHMILNQLDQVTPEVLNSVGQKYIYDKCPVVAAVGPSECLSDYERIKAGMYLLRL